MLFEYSSTKTKNMDMFDKRTPEYKDPYYYLLIAPETTEHNKYKLLSWVFTPMQSVFFALILSFVTMTDTY